MARWYEQHGYDVVARNWRCAEGEIDLVCASRPSLSSETTLVVCEVKTRTSEIYGHPLEAVTPSKRARLRRLAGTFLRSQGEHYAHVRFDVAAVMGCALEVVEGAF